MAETPFLPLEIIQIILSKLFFVKALLRFKSVSKSWNSIISDPLFVKSHHQQQSKSSQDLFVRRVPISGEFTLVKLEDKKFRTIQKLDSPYCNYVICRCEGALLLTDHFRIQVLWDPSTRTEKQFSIPFPGSRYGLCPDPGSDGFKVVIVNRDDYSVYSVKNRSLIIDRKKFDGLSADYGRAICRKAVCVDGAVYWIWSRENVDKIIYYDPRDDEFKVLEKPQYVKDDDGKRIFLADLGGSLCLYCEGEDETTIKIWVKEKGIDNSSWNHLITIGNLQFGIVNFEPQCLLGNKIVIQERFGAPDFVVYSPLEKTFEQLGEMEFGWCYGYRLVPYVDTPARE